MRNKLKRNPLVLQVPVTYVLGWSAWYIMFDIFLFHFLFQPNQPTSCPLVRTHSSPEGGLEVVVDLVHAREYRWNNGGGSSSGQTSLRRMPFDVC